MKKLEMKYRSFICVIMFYLIFMKEFIMVILRKEPLTFARDFFSYCSLQVQA